MLLDKIGTATALVVTVDPEEPTRLLALEKSVRNHKLYRFDPSSPIDGIKFADHADDIFIIDTLSSQITLVQHS